MIHLHLSLRRCYSVLVIREALQLHWRMLGLHLHFERHGIIPKDSRSTKFLQLLVSFLFVVSNQQEQQLIILHCDVVLS